jgi:DNA-3-methyladenine glycosylase
MADKRLGYSFFGNDVLRVAPALLGNTLVCCLKNGEVVRHVITETEAYKGEEDLGCHASKGKTERNKVMYEKGGLVYVYLVYGMYWMLNFVTGKADQPQAVLIRGIEGYNGPGKLTRYLGIGKDFYGEDITLSKRMWIEKSTREISYTTTPRIGIDYAGDYWKNIPWRFVLNNV